MSFLKSAFLFILFVLIRVNSQTCPNGLCPNGLTCCDFNICYNSNNDMCCGSQVCTKGSTCNTGSGYSTCTTTLSPGEIAGIVIGIIFFCCCVPIGIFLCCFGGLAMLQKTNQPPPSQQPVYVVSQPPPGQPVYATNQAPPGQPVYVNQLPPGYVQGQAIPPIDNNAKMDQIGVASAPNM